VEIKPKSFWKKPEGITGIIFLLGALAGAGYLVVTFASALLALLTNTVFLAGLILVLGVIIYMVLDPKMRTLISYFYKSVMRWITALFVQIDPIGILKNYLEDLRDNLSKMSRQVMKLRAQMHKLKELIINNQKEIKSNLNLASKAKESNNRNTMILKSRKAGRLKESNFKLEDMYKKMEVLYRVLSRMYDNSEIMMEDLDDQVKLKEQERIAMRASHSAMKSAMSVISGDSDKRAMFDAALEAVADDVSKKVGEMERFMALSDNFMSSIDLQNGIFEEEGLAMLEKWEKEGDSLLLGEEKETLLLLSHDDEEKLDLNTPIKKREKIENHKNQYDTFFE
jgi:hypothetical protein